MTLDRLISPQDDAITCQKYSPIAGQRRCEHYIANGGCALPDELMCVEWLKRNEPSLSEPSTRPVLPHNAPQDASEHSGGASGVPVTERAPAAASASTAGIAPSPSAGRLKLYDPHVPGWKTPSDAVERLDALRRSIGIPNDVALAELEQSGVEATLRLANGQALTLVPARTEKCRIEMSFRTARQLMPFLEIFPGAELVEWAMTETVEAEEREQRELQEFSERSFNQ